MIIQTNILSLFLVPVFIFIYISYLHPSKKKISTGYILFFSVPIMIYILTKNNTYIIISQILSFYLFLFFHKRANRCLEYLLIILYTSFIKLLSYVMITWFMDLLSNEVIFPISYTIALADILFALILLFTAFTMKRFLSKAREYTSSILMIIIILIVLYFTYLVTIFQKRELLLESSIELCLITVLIFLVYNVIKKLVQIEKENSLITLHNQELSFHQKNYNQLEQNIKEIKRIKHDLNHLFRALLEYSNNNECEKITETLELQVNTMNNFTDIIKTGNSTLDLILSSYISLFKSNDIEFIINYFDEEIKIDKIDLYTILGNLIDNSIENCTSNATKKIILDIYTEDDFLMINLKNTCLLNPLQDNPQLHTTKEHYSEHGIGLKSIEILVHKYNGSIEYKYSLFYFIVDVKLKNTL